ncbi:hypothetical protein FRC12_004730 [Ceratobasidium sp. 428]|nr:hypothetical protein FRC12_004730 [Ceratobasidium sp. 428]
MPPAPSEVPQLAPSQFAYFKSTQPLTTASGVIPGRALFDSPLPNPSPSPPLEQSHRTRKPSTRKVEAESTQPSTSKSQPKTCTTGKQNGKNVKNTGKASTSKSAVISESQVGGTQIATQGGAGVNGAETQGEYDSQGEADEEREEYGETLRPDSTVEELEATLGHSVDHLSAQQIKNLLDKVRETQALALGAQVQSAPTVTQPLAGLGLAGGNLDGSTSHEDSGERSQRPDTIASSEGPLNAPKRRLDAPAGNTASKRARVTTAKDGSGTESEESDGDSDSSRHRSSSDDDDDDNDKDPEIPPLPPRLSHKPRGPALAQLKSNSAARGPLARPSAVASAKLPTNTPAAGTSTTNLSPDYLALHPPPTNLNDNEALVGWALKIVEEQSRKNNVNPGPSNPRPQRPDTASTTATTNHVAQAITNY